MSLKQNETYNRDFEEFNDILVNHSVHVPRCGHPSRVYAAEH
jgi:hypothetical protein